MATTNIKEEGGGNNKASLPKEKWAETQSRFTGLPKEQLAEYGRKGVRTVNQMRKDGKLPRYTKCSKCELVLTCSRAYGEYYNKQDS